MSRRRAVRGFTRGKIAHRRGGSLKILEPPMSRVEPRIFVEMKEPKRLHPSEGQRRMVSFDPAAYGAWFESALGRRVWADEERVILDLLGEIGGSRVLDAGCGDGRLAAKLASGGARVVAVDVGLDMLRAARKRHGADYANLSLVQADIERLPLASEMVDLVVTVTTLCFVANPKAVARELARVLRPGGYLVVGELGRWSLWAVRRRLRALVGGGPWAAARFWTRATLFGLLRDAGLAPLAARGAIFYPRSALLARTLGPLDRTLGKGTTIGAAFVAVAAEKPRTSPPPEHA